MNYDFNCDNKLFMNIQLYFWYYNNLPNKQQNQAAAVDSLPNTLCTNLMVLLLRNNPQSGLSAIAPNIPSMK
jgi:hypothetical protein